MREFVVEADGGSRGNPGPAGYGAAVIDPKTGETLAEAAEYIGVATNNVAEYKGLIAGLKAAKALDADASVRVRMDSKLVVEQMSGRWKIKHPDMKPLAAEAARILPSSQVTYEWIPREKNKHADRLANEAMDAGKKGKRWEPSRSTAALGARDAEAARVVGDAAAGAAKARAALSGSVAPSGSAGEAVATPPVGWGAADLGAPATFVLLRHGETVLTPEKRFSGSGGSDPSLSAVGVRQAEAVASALAARGTVQEIVSSPLKRCRETAEAVAARLNLDVRIEDGLRETDFGAWEGLTFAEVRERYAEDLTAWLASPKATPTGGGESFATVARRVSSTRDKLLAHYPGRTVLLVTHVTPVKTLVRLALGAPPESLFRMELSAASLSVVAYYADGNASLRLLNDTSHLR
ncbi:bifunctional RNase H/acid phosphatase [Streptomyces lunaelactis]|uniref:bifunctional RNase H/acid phosphatase n=1 Tax=Streptomyces lunaelactis TaxID=1535768 RepID=UPI0015858357|nr:bifunctional RNase H/acid phosphatase [Streptomyces lunaelactis]NUK34415.1 bifunctional RNase H/acid phosphatase [Streptomyces lunaelactis]NUK44116.1 bifunctional RNase H/acid phosphatase [Streptomyces lunaelactis]NUK55241.1 bifunctional RNase H/acid phosphatase [Streptomyces lunaelactis]NUK60048.1 bifunctional RNase H/acid phosphatase [Streptomyces lunaelactis]NUK67673.1 bifunctional RNase H/acid phosphatase [Streptomyces lunaelactis]